MKVAGRDDAIQDDTSSPHALFPSPGFQLQAAGGPIVRRRTLGEGSGVDADGCRLLFALRLHGVEPGSIRDRITWRILLPLAIRKEVSRAAHERHDRTAIDGIAHSVPFDRTAADVVEERLQRDARAEPPVIKVARPPIVLR